MLEVIRRDHGALPVVIVSAYDHFPYAQRAIRLGAFDYLVKPYSGDVVGQIVHHVKRLAPGSDAAQRGSAQNIHVSSMLARWLTDPKRYAPELIRYLEHEEDAPLPGRLILLRGIFRDAASRAFFSSIRMTLTEDLRDALSSWIAPRGASLVFATGEEIVAALFAGRGGLAEADMDSLRVLLSAWLTHARLRRGAELAVAIGELSSDLIGRVHETYYPLRALIEYHFYQEKPEPRLSGDVDADSGRSVSEVRLNELLFAMKEGYAKGVRRAVSGLFAQLSTPPYMPVQRMIHTLHKAAEDFLEQADVAIPLPARESFQDRLREACEYAVSIGAFEENYCAIVSDIAAKIDAFSQNKSESIIDRCIEYVSVHYGDPALTEETMAQRFHFSPGYFGTLFKAGTGQTFIPYLNRLRVEKARAMLTGSHMKVYEIANRAGFSDFRYFIRVFKKLTGVSPSRYRAMATPPDEGKI
jgi:two-component system response regulator YesN